MIDILHPEIERRGNDSTALALMLQIHEDVKETDRKLTEHIVKEDETGGHRIKQAVVEAMSLAYPEGDASGHRRHHEAIINRAEEKAAFWAKMRFEITRAGLIGFISWAAWVLIKAAVVGARGQ